MAKDILGREIKTTYIVAYPVRFSSSMWMSHGQVTEVGKDFIKVSIDTVRWSGEKREKPKVVTVRSLDRVVIARGA